MASRCVLLGLLLVLSACNFSIEPSYVPPEPAEDAGQEDGGVDAAEADAAGPDAAGPDAAGPDAAQPDTGKPTDAGAEAGPDASLSRWCRETCAVEDGDTCRRVTCADAAVCVDEPACESCLFCHDE